MTLSSAVLHLFFFFFLGSFGCFFHSLSWLEKEEELLISLAFLGWAPPEISGGFSTFASLTAIPLSLYVIELIAMHQQTAVSVKISAAAASRDWLWRQSLINLLDVEYLKKQIGTCVVFNTVTVLCAGFLFRAPPLSLFSSVSCCCGGGGVMLHYIPCFLISSGFD